MENLKDEIERRNLKALSKTRAGMVKTLEDDYKRASVIKFYKGFTKLNLRQR